MKKLLFTLFILSLTGSIHAQENGSRHLSMEEFNAKQKAFITEKAKLSEEEAGKFFPMFFELQSKKKALGEKAWKKVKKEQEAQTTDAQYEEILDNLYDSRIKVAQLEKDYYEKFRQILSPKKLYLIHAAEMRFKRDILKWKNDNTPCTKDKRQKPDTPKRK